MTILDTPPLQAFVACAHNGWLQGWHERNGGNLSYRMAPEEARACRPWFGEAGPWLPLGVAAPGLAGEYFVVTGTNRYFQNIKGAPGENIGIAQLNGQGDAYRVVWGLTAGRQPTSEFPTHIRCHAVRASATHGASRVIYHAHPVDVVALTFVLPATAKAFSRALWQAMTECVIIFPEGVGVVPWMVCGGTEIARATAGEMERFAAVIWAQHGIFCAGEGFDETFGMMHAIDKAARIVLRVMAAGLPVLQTITDDNLRAVAGAFGRQVNEEFLDGSAVFR
ncbi:MAG: rhamnulose-1-phosphate aldolase [Oscillospiraceae bacterium]|jgi:rhamnulose-1-phosphate aldolase|nr:rhamnulose-1-phosphate aldolase [Oscillospiraceae bacterium]